ncbi:MAG: helix-hairpin-helix domain-containing protein [Eubacteriales bacterium]
MDIKEYFSDKKNNLIFVIIVIGCIIIFWLYKLFPNTDKIYTAKEDINEIQEETQEFIIVHIAGEVENPGIVKLNDGQRLYEAIEEAGGITKEGDVDGINLAMILQDGQKINIPNKNINENSKQSDDGLININTAEKEILMTLPGIGDTLAGSIIDYREKNNGFRNIEEIKNVPRIGNVTFERMKDEIKAE